MQNPKNQSNFQEIGSSSRIVEGNDYRGGEVGMRIIDPRTWDTYLRIKQIGSNGLCRVYRVLHSRCLEELICVVLPYKSQGSIRYMISTHPYNNLPEDFIALLLLIRLRDRFHVQTNPRPHNREDELVHLDDATARMLIKLAFEASICYETGNINWVIKFEESYDSDKTSSFLDPKGISKWGAAPEVFASENENNRGPKSDIWLLGITALELAYGNLPVRNRRDLERIVKKIKKTKKLPKSLVVVIKKKKELNSVKRKKRVFSKEFEENSVKVVACLNENPEKRPRTDEILNAPFFTSAIEKFKKFVFNGNN